MHIHHPLNILLVRISSIQKDKWLKWILAKYEPPKREKRNNIVRY